MVALLQNIENMRARMGYDDRPEVNRAIEAALETSSVSVPQSARVNVTRVTVIDTFFVKNSLEYGNVIHRRFNEPAALVSSGRATTTSLKLSRQLLDSVAAITVFAASSELGLDNTDARQDLQLVDGDDRTAFDFVRGYLRVNDYGLANCYVRATYTAGLLTDDGDPAVFAGAPDWLVQAVSLDAQLMLNANPVVRAKELAEDERRSVQRRLDRLIVDNTTYLPMSWKPVHSVETLV